MIHFEMQGCQEHRDLCWDHGKLSEDANGNEYLVYNGGQTKTRSDVDASNVRKVSPKMFSIGSEQDPVAVYKIYRDKRPKNMMPDDASFYLGINYPRKGSSKNIWFKAASIGVKKLNTENDGFESKHQQRASHQP